MEVLAQVFNRLKDVGLATTVIALITILVIGCIKFIPNLHKISKKGRKAIYQSINIVVSGGLAILYNLVIAHGSWDAHMMYVVMTAIAEVNVLYPIYENYSIRDLVRKLLSLILPNYFKTKEKAEVTGVVARVKAEKKVIVSDVEKSIKESKKDGWIQ